MTLKYAAFKPTCKLCGKQLESHYAYCNHIDVDHNFNPRRKDDLERYWWQVQNDRNKGVRLK